MESKGIRINKFLSEAGVCSRRKADEYIEAGWVCVNDVIAEKGTKVTTGDRVTVKGTEVSVQEQKVVLAFYKPRGLVCSAQGQGATTVFDYLQYPGNLYYVGRLDKDSEGLLLLTNDGDLANAISKARYGHEKEYEVVVNRPVNEGFIRKMSQGVPILDTVTKECQVWQTGQKQFSIILTQGLNRQIRRMCEYCGYRVKRLKRVRVMNIELGDLEPGAYRELNSQELTELQRRIHERE
ncbi:MAG: pseudouridine synthase [Lachnospiraceae bacterium]|nr:pseudouridine synthase [Lachnospiraceae bacterium]